MRLLILRLLIACSLLIPSGSPAAPMVICGAGGLVAIDWPAPDAPSDAAVHTCCKALSPIFPTPAPGVAPLTRMTGARIALSAPRPQTALAAPAGFHARAPPRPLV